MSTTTYQRLEDGTWCAYRTSDCTGYGPTKAAAYQALLLDESRERQWAEFDADEERTIDRICHGQ
jgi:hypothetical protein